jgi:FlaA1/EpsC-like NDP-sugar epimerase
MRGQIDNEAVMNRKRNHRVLVTGASAGIGAQRITQMTQTGLARIRGPRVLTNGNLVYNIVLTVTLNRLNIIW